MENTLDPLLQELTGAYIDEHDLSLRLKALFEVLLCIYIYIERDCLVHMYQADMEYMWRRQFCFDIEQQRSCT